ncbi:SH3 domain-containing protein [Priestia megaterium]|uniref:SH3 domain-containing protein n=3 Tax=Priestia megaterium TaxID=1404 RepID=UPI00234F65E8|nr:SH3 domain-containing protein [Priestia megaterium]MDC7724469.1 SH3 domain-containing protein [Priestia megaterium]
MNKKIIIPFTVLTMAFTAVGETINFNYANNAEAATVKTGTATSNLNVRQTASTSAKKVTTLAKGTTVTINETKNDWYHITSGKYSGWVSSSYIKVIQAPSNNTSKPVTVNTTVKTGTTTSNLNVRQTASTSAKKVTTLTKGTTVTINETKNDWYRITSGKYSGWVSSSYIKVIQAPSNNTSKPVTVNTTVKTGTTTSNLNVRQTASTSAKKVTTLTKGTTVTINETKNGWYRITSGKYSGWVSSSYIKVSAQTTSPVKPDTNTSKPDANTTPTTKPPYQTPPIPEVNPEDDAPYYPPVLDVPKATEAYTTTRGVQVYAVDPKKSEAVTITNSWNLATKQKEYEALGASLGLPYDSTPYANRAGLSVDFTDRGENTEIGRERGILTGPAVSIGSFIDVKLKEIDFVIDNSQAGYADSNKDIQKPMAEYVLAKMLQPYIPNHFDFVIYQYYLTRKNGVNQTVQHHRLDGYDVTINWSRIIIKPIQKVN